MSDPFEQLRLIKEARQERREDLREIADDHIGNIASAILLMNAASINARLADADPNTEVDVESGDTSVNGTDVNAATDAANPTSPAAVGALDL